MSEDAYKRRIREWKRREADKSRPDSLAHQGWRIRTFDSGPFHILACRGRSSLAVCFCFGTTGTDDILAVSREPMPDRCRREIWQISEDGRAVVKAKIAASPE